MFPLFIIKFDILINKNYLSYNWRETTNLLQLLTITYSLHIPYIFLTYSFNMESSQFTSTNMNSDLFLCLTDNDLQIYNYDDELIEHIKRISNNKYILKGDNHQGGRLITESWKFINLTCYVLKKCLNKNLNHLGVVKYLNKLGYSFHKEVHLFNAGRTFNISYMIYRKQNI